MLFLLNFTQDIVLADSLEVAQVKFEFNQVKTTTGKIY